MIYFTADHHFGHKNIIKHCNRPYENVDEMNKDLILKWNSTVSNSDVVYFLGDFAFHPKHDTLDIIKELNGFKIMIMGNHDRNKTATAWKRLGFNVVFKQPVILDNKYLLTHEPIYDFNYFNIHAHTHDHRGHTDYSYCVSVEMTNYIPVSYDAIKQYKDAIASSYATGKEEYYANKN